MIRFRLQKCGGCMERGGKSQDSLCQMSLICPSRSTIFHSPLCLRKLATWTASVSRHLWLGLFRGRHHKELGVLEADEVGFIPPGCCELAASLRKASSPPTTTLPNGSKQSLKAQSANNPFCNQPHRYCIISRPRPVSLLTFPQITSLCYMFPAGTLINKWTN